MGGGGVQRTTKFVKYLPDFGWRPVVLAADDRSYWARDETLVAEIPRGTVVRRLPPRRPDLLYALFSKIASRTVAHKVLDNIFLPDDRIFWALSAAFSALPMLKREGISLIYSTSPPHSSHIAALMLKRLTGLPWVADFRDPWTGDFRYDPPTSWVRRAHGRCEKKILTRADRVICITETARKRYISDFGIDPGRLATIYNGFDARDFERPPKVKRGRDDRIVITHSGSFYGTYFPRTFFLALAKALKKDPALKRRLVVRFVGVMDKAIEERIRDMLPDNTVFDGYVSHKEALGAVMESDINLIALPFKKEIAYHVPGKIFEYLAAMRPILAAVPEGETAQLVRLARAGIVVGQREAEPLSERLAYAIAELQKRDRQVRGDRIVQDFERRKLTERLSQVFNEAAGG
jgi:glycosyltransferase involved in cell wall biosynthesis